MHIQFIINRLQIRLNLCKCTHQLMLNLSQSLVEESYVRLILTPLFITAKCLIA